MTMIGVYNENYNFMKYFGFDSIKEVINSSFGFTLLKTLYKETFILFLLSIYVFWFGMDALLHNINSYLFSPAQALLVTFGIIIADTIAGAYRGFKSAEGFSTKKATRLFPKLFATGLFLGGYFYIHKFMITPLNITWVTEILDKGKTVMALALGGIHFISAMKNATQAGLLPESFTTWFESKIDKYKDKVDEVI